MSGARDFDAAMQHLAALRAILEPDGGAIEWKGQPTERVREFLRSAAAVTWNLGIASETIIGEVGITLPRGD